MVSDKYQINVVGVSVEFRGEFHGEDGDEISYYLIIRVEGKVGSSHDEAICLWVGLWRGGRLEEWCF